MSRLIDGDALIEFIDNRYDITWKDDYEGGIKDACTDIIEEINKMPTIETERKTGKWIRHEPFDGEHKNCNKCIECSNCGTWFGADCYAETSYCPSCGAKMEEGDRE